MNEEMLSIASQSDLEEMSLLNVPFMKELNAEIEAQRSGLIRWDVLKDDGVITGCHRTVLLSGWGFCTECMFVLQTVISGPAIS